MKRLFDDKEERWSDEAYALHNEIYGTLKPVYLHAAKERISTIDLSYIANLALTDLILETRLGWLEPVKDETPETT